YLKSKANLEYFKNAYERQKSLIEQNIGSQKFFQEAKAEYEKAQAESIAEDKKIHSIGLSHEDLIVNSSPEHTAGYLPIKSPINGIVAERNVVIGQLVDATTNAFKIINITSLWADGQIYEKDLKKLSGPEGMFHKPKIEFTTTAYPNEKFSGTTILIGQTVDERTRTIKFRASLKNKNNKLKPQMFGEMFIPVTGSAKGIVVPNDAIIKEGGKSFVFAALDDTTFSKKIVELGNNLGDMTEIVSGLSEGEKIVVKGAFFLKSELMKEMMKESD
ncbi:MAG: efflux RND transporter periplasmic adaptor subunit, partial [Bacteroidota bacterium]